MGCFTCRHRFPLRLEVPDDGVTHVPIQLVPLKAVAEHSRTGHCTSISNIEPYFAEIEIRLCVVVLPAAQCSCSEYVHSLRGAVLLIHEIRHMFVRHGVV